MPAAAIFGPQDHPASGLLRYARDDQLRAGPAVPQAVIGYAGKMIYVDGKEAMLGDQVSISGVHRAVVVACLDRSEYSGGYAQADWEYLERGILVETDFGGLVHYPEAGGEHFELVARSADR